MRFFAITATLFAAASAHYSAPAEESCSTVTITKTIPAVPVGTEYPVYPVVSSAVVPVGTGYPVVPSVVVPSGTGYPVVPAASSPPYPTGAAPYPSVPAPAGTGYPSVPAPAGTGYPVVPASSAAPYPSVPAPAGTGYPVVPAPAGSPAPSGTGAYTPALPEFTGAASAMNVPAVAAGIMGLAAYFL